MIYTYGDEASYDAALEDKKAKNEKLHKMGNTDYLELTGSSYSGGAVWETVEEVQAHIETLYCDGYAVYELEGEWENVYQVVGEPYYRLQEDRVVLGKYKCQK